MSSILTRRNFLKTAAAAGAASAAAPALAASSQSTAAPKHWDQTVDVVVLGAGGAGLMAACQVYDKKGKVVVFDKSYSPYHSATRMCGGLFTAYGSDVNGRILRGTSDKEVDVTKWNALTSEQQAKVDTLSGATMSLRDGHGDILGAIEKAWKNAKACLINVK